MSVRIPRQFIDDLLLRVDIVDLIDRHVPLKKTGGNYVARCPFHTEKTPSFIVTPNRQTYHCFGCGVSGNAISFLMAFNHLDFVEAVDDLAAFAGLEAPRENPAKTDFKVKPKVSLVYETLEHVTEFYAERLRSDEGATAIAYLRQRGVNDEVIQRFCLGYAPDSWDALVQCFDRQALLEAGMLVQKQGGGTYDRFRGRLMFPIRDKRKKVVGFGGRVLDDSTPKYLNSPETAVFSKSKELYGISELLVANPRPKLILIVEGYMDVISLAQFGIFNSVAALGTATSKAHMDLLFRFTAELVFCFDGDQAGRQAAWKAVEAALPCLRDGRQIKIMLLPGGQDPDSLIRQEGLEAFQQRIDAACVMSDYFFEHVCENVSLHTVEGRSRLVAIAKPQLEKLPPGFFREMMLSRLQELSGARILAVGENPTRLASDRSNKLPLTRSTPRSNLMRKILSLLLQYPSLARHVEQHAGRVAQISLAGIDLLLDVLQVIAVEKPENQAVLLEYYRDTPHYKAINALSNLTLELGVDAESEFCGALNQLLKQSEENRISELIDKLSRGEVLTAEEKKMLKAGGKNINRNDS